MDCSTPRFPVLLSPEVCSNSCQLNRWCQTTISISDALFPCPQSFPASGPFPASWLFTSGGQSIEALASVLPNEYSAFISIRIDWFHLLAVQGTLKYLLQHHSSKNINSLVLSLLYGPTLTSVHNYWKNHSFDLMDLCQQWCLFLTCCLGLS